VAIQLTTELSEQRKKAFDFAQDLTKLLITLATGIITLTITFMKDVVAGAPHSARKWIEIAWVLYLVSMIGGIVALMALTSSLEKDDDPSIYGKSVTIPSGVQFVLFFAAVAFTIYFGREALKGAVATTK
jgi:hypothetical protein